MLAVALVGAVLADDTFHPGPGAAVLDYGDLLARGQVLGRTGRVLVRADADLMGVPGVAKVVPLRGGLLRVEPAPGVDDLALARALHARPGVRWAMPDLLLPIVPAAVPDDPLYGDQWHLENTGQGGRTPDVDIDAAGAWAYATGAGQIVAVLDSGVQVDHPDLSVIAGRDYVDGDDDPNPSTDASAPHGTGVAGIAAAMGDNGVGVAGVAWGADVYAIRLIGGSSSSTEALYESFAEAIDAGATVLNNSWGFGTDCSGVPDYAVFDEMFDYAEDVGRGGLGSAVVFAAGNNGCDNDNDGMLAHRSLVVVAALEWWDTRASYSNYGSIVDIAAPTSVLTTDITPGGYGSYAGDDAYNDYFSGTSGATPVVSGVLALMFEANPRLTAKQARSVLCDTAVRVDLDDAGYDDEGWSPYYGCGRVDAGAAVAAVANTAPSAPAPRLVAETAELPRVTIAWSPAADPDGDVASYVVRATVGDAGLEREVAGTTLDLAGDVAAGDVVTWTVAAVDPWGEGEASEPVTFTVVAEPEPVEVVVEEAQPGGCVSAPGSVAGALAGLLLAARRRRAQRGG
jgi:subtilisin family serine protease